MQDLWQAHYQILLIILLKEFMKLKVNTDMRIKTVNHVKLTTNIVGVFYYTNFKDDLCCNKNYKKKLMKP